MELDWGQMDERPVQRPDFPGVYCFWWGPGAADFLDRIDYPHFHLHGPGGTKPPIFDVTPARCIDVDGRLPLYVGKTSKPISKRFTKHLLLSKTRTLPEGEAARTAQRYNTSCQIRDRLDRVFENQPNTLDIALNNLMVSYVEMRDVADRYFYEVQAIAAFQSICNVDSER